MTDKERKDIVVYRLEKANNSLLEVELLLENAMHNAAVNRLYYACFYAVTAILIHNKIASETHSGVRQMLGLHFIKTGRIKPELGKFYSQLFNKRQSGDYDDFVEYSHKDIIELIPLAKKLIKAIEKLIA